MLPVFEFDLIETDEFIMSDVFDMTETSEFETSFLFDYMDFQPAPQQNSYFSGVGSAVAGCNIYFVPQNVLQAASVFTSIDLNILNPQNLRDGTSRVRVPFRLGDWVKATIQGYDVNFISIYNFQCASNFDYTIYDAANLPVLTGTFPDTPYSSYVILPRTYTLGYIKISKPRGAIETLGEIYIGLSQQPAIGYLEKFTLTPEVIGTDQSSDYCNAEVISGKRRNFTLQFQLEHDTDVDVWEAMFYSCKKHKQIGTSNHYVAYPMCVVINSVAYLMSVGMQIEIPHDIGECYNLSLSLKQEGIGL